MKTLFLSLVCLCFACGGLCAADRSDPFSFVVGASSMSVAAPSLDAPAIKSCPCGIPGCSCPAGCVCGGGETAPVNWNCGPNGCYPQATMVVQAPNVGVQVQRTATAVCPCCGMAMPARTAIVAAPMTYSVPVTTTYTTTSYTADVGAVAVVTRDGILGRWRARRAARLSCMGY